jgi:hypothetical protein
LFFLGFGALTTPAWAQERVAPGELAGTVMKASTVDERVHRRQDRRWITTFQSDYIIEFVSKDEIRQTTIGTQKGTVNNPNRVLKYAPVGGGLITLGRPSRTSDGYVIWIFDGGVLAYLRAYERGGLKRTFAVARSGAGFICTAGISWLREAGSPSIVFRNPDGVWTETLSSKQTAWSCEIGINDADPRAPAAKGTGPPPKSGSECFTFDGRQLCE